MQGNDRSKITTHPGGKKKILIAAAAVAVFVIAFFFLVFFFGMQVGDPRGEAPGPGP